MPPTVSYLTDVFFEPGAAKLVPELLRKLGVARPLVVTDEGLAGAGMVGRLGLREPAVFAGVHPNPTEDDVERGLEVYRQGGCDGVVALGGGSPMDCAKCVALLATHPPPLEAYAFLRGGLPKITGAKPPVVAVPTTAGTGSEVGRGAVMTFRSGRKLAVISQEMIPEAAVCDPELTLDLPRGLTAATGVDAISHCVETYLSPRFNPVAEAIALDGLARGCRWLRDACRNGRSLEARSEMMVAALEGGLTFQKGLGAVHSLSHAIGALVHRKLHHGTLNAVFLPHVLRFNALACPRPKLEAVARAAGAAGPGDLPGFFERLSAELGLPPRLRDLGVTLEELEPLAPLAKEDHTAATNPLPLSVDACRELFRAAW
ncbi:MAG: iron-containing alcohol dehydrogenase [Planctomycetes bacterium]|nr:iron-containing alcohol dehydrogenase [Planctomycetota bacterium]